MRILHVNYTDSAGGAARVARDLFYAMRAEGHDAALGVAIQSIHDAGIYKLATQSSAYPWSDPFRRLGNQLHGWALGHRGLGAGRAAKLIHAASDFPNLRWLDHLMGHETFRFAGTGRLIDDAPLDPEVVQVHNLHGGYFDLRSLPDLSRARPLVLSLHDLWLLSGHCAHSLDCDRWKTGCGACPDLTLYPALMRDGTAFNWKRKADVFRRSRLYVTAPSGWAMDRARASMLWPGVRRSRVIGNPIDIDLFRPAVRAEARRRLGLDPEAHIILLAANGIRRNRFKDWDTFAGAMKRLAELPTSRRIQVIGLGEKAPEMRFGGVSMVFKPHVPREAMAEYFAASTVFVHSTRVETFGLVVAEAMACGLPVVATRAGGVPEVMGVDHDSDAQPDCGRLTRSRDAADMAQAIHALLGDEAMRSSMGELGTKRARREFGMDRITREYLDFYREIIEDHAQDPWRDEPT